MWMMEATNSLGILNQALLWYVPAGTTYKRETEAQVRKYRSDMIYNLNSLETDVTAESSARARLSSMCTGYILHKPFTAKRPSC